MLEYDLLAAVLCDDIRTENNGKDILIGVYKSEIVVSDFPANLLLSMWIQILPKNTGEFTGEVRVIKKDGSVLVKGLSKLNISECIPSVIQFNKMPTELQGEGPITYQWRFGEGEWQTIKEINVIPQPTPSSATA